MDELDQLIEIWKISMDAERSEKERHVAMCQIDGLYSVKRGKDVFCVNNNVNYCLYKMILNFGNEDIRKYCLRNKK